MNSLATLQLYLTHPHDCSYLSDQRSTTLFVDPSADIDQHSYSQLSNMGFRRSGPHVYRPHCQSCQACVPIRVLTQKFSPSRSQTRCLKRNQDLQLELVSSIADDEFYCVYERYINQRHRDGDMYPATREQYDNFLTSEWGVTRYLVSRDTQGKLIAVAVIDLLDEGLSAIYTFFDPDEHRRSLGVFCILSQIQWAQSHQLPYVFLGYWIKDCQKMNYKTQYKPYQLHQNDHWISAVSD